jgi:hypothetical protein
MGTYMLDCSDQDQQLENNEFGESFAAIHVFTQATLEPYYGDDCPDCDDELEGLDL